MFFKKKNELSNFGTKKQRTNVIKKELTNLGIPKDLLLTFLRYAKEVKPEPEMLKPGEERPSTPFYGLC